MEVPIEEIFDLNIFGKWKKFGNSIVEITVNRKSFDRFNSYLKSMTLFEKNSKLLITDNRENEYKGEPLHICDLNGNRIESFNPGKKLTCPGAICILTFSNKEEIFIANKEKHLELIIYQEYVWKILVFRSNFEFKFEIIYSKLSTNPNFIPEFFEKNHSPYFMQIDNEFNNTRLYVSDHFSDRITIYNTGNGELIDVINILNPGSMIFSSDYIYVASVGQSNTTFSDIFKIRKDTLEVERVIVNREPYTKMYLLGFDLFKNIIMLAFDLNELKRSQTLHNYYVAIDENGKTITKYLTDLTEVHDALVIKNMIYIINQNELRQLEFRR